ncbi:tRNA adenosine(34) deaminase TadA [Anaerosalibacter bizertensis]|uniref:tRNA-specific adenosine deaminase n=1 Tax=Anaerosalibacter bizertensis TaxID=932217 RepID=A0A9Q4FLR1_9FIRM|nr:tRNA adenosine(34) deaminase TadA [Anaerosalibacter bizertensis]MCB5560495.1 tRNA adenosine(34) deaminase TadA [Anaerosalibacter bizertensis]MCG4564982.1 tRNA adenosine(34) deaminase TadA [Anaerosalibacter bizertensis]MCG4583135.1 tRNA adenosine(34) deaminase TadA [Anaerosalibacter bizertensis]MCG4585756.1 tRNA adenosine(34) deaminase TadA [Anaerosalibacter bizertensis]
MDEMYMELAFKEAEKAFNILEVPVGAIVVHNGKVIATGYNMRETTKDPTAHAEIIAIKKASEYLGGWRLLDCTMYVTLEPCPMCAGAILNSRIDRLVIGTKDYKMGCCGTVVDLLHNNNFNHSVDTKFGVLETECREILKTFFKKLRQK